MMSQNKNYIFIEGLEVNASVGIYDHEKMAHQLLIVSLEAECLQEIIFTKDDINETLNYEKIITIIHTTIEKQHYNLIETLAETIAANLLQIKEINTLTIEIKKPSVLGSNSRGILGVKIKREKLETS